MTLTILYNHDTSLIDSVYLSKSSGLDAARNNRSLTPMTFSVSDSPPTPASIEQEADRLYPYHPQNDEVYTDSMVTNIQRSAHITAARMYMGEVDKYRKALEEIAAIGRQDEIFDIGGAVFNMAEIASQALNKTI